MNENSKWILVWNSVVKKHTLNPIWSQEMIPLSTLCNGDKLCPLLIEVYDHKRSGKHVFMGKVETSVRDLEHVREPKILLEPLKAGQKGYANSGTLTASDVLVISKPTFWDVSIQVFFALSKCEYIDLRRNEMIVVCGWWLRDFAYCWD